MCQHRTHFLIREYHGHALRSLGAYDIVEPRKLDIEYCAIQEKQCAQCLILRRRRDATLSGQVAQERLDLGATHDGRVAFPMKQNEAPYPCDILLFGPIAVVPESEALSDSLEQAWLRVHAASPVLAFDGLFYSGRALVESRICQRVNRDIRQFCSD